MCDIIIIAKIFLGIEVRKTTDSCEIVRLVTTCERAISGLKHRRHLSFVIPLVGFKTVFHFALACQLSDIILMGCNLSIDIGNCGFLLLFEFGE